MSQTFTNPAGEPPNDAQSQLTGGYLLARPAGPLDAIPAGLITGAPSTVTLTSSPGSVAADTRIFVYGYGDLTQHSPLGSQLSSATWYQPNGGGPNLGFYAPPPNAGYGPQYSLGWWLVAEKTLSVAAPQSLGLPSSGIVPLTSEAQLLAVAQSLGIQQAPAGVAVQVPGYDPGTRYYTQAGQPKYQAGPGPGLPAPTPYTAFIALVGPVAGNYNFSVS